MKIFERPKLTTTKNSRPSCVVLGQCARLCHFLSLQIGSSFDASIGLFFPGAPHFLFLFPSSSHAFFILSLTLNSMKNMQQDILRAGLKCNISDSQSGILPSFSICKHRKALISSVLLSKFSGFITSKPSPSVRKPKQGFNSCSKIVPALEN